MINKMTMHHSEFIGYIANIYKPNTYVELGLYHGETLKKVIPHARKLYGVDINQNNDIEHIKDNNSNVILSYEKTDVFFEKFNEGIDMAFIDADHCVKSALKDFENVFKLLNDNGIILMHDTDPEFDYLIDPGYCGDSYKIVDLFKNDNRLNIITLPVSEAGLSLITKKNNTRKQLRSNLFLY